MATTATITLDATHAELGVRTIWLSLVLDEYPVDGYVLDLSGYFGKQLLSCDVQGVSADGEAMWADITLDSRTPASGAVLKLYKSRTQIITCGAEAAAIYDPGGIYWDHSAKQMFSLQDTAYAMDDRTDLPPLTDVSSLTVYIRAEGN